MSNKQPVTRSISKILMLRVPYYDILYALTRSSAASPRPRHNPDGAPSRARQSISPLPLPTADSSSLSWSWRIWVGIRAGG